MCKANETVEESDRRLDYPAESYLDLACKSSEVVDRTIQKYGEQSLAVYLTHLNPNSASPFQERHDLVDAVYRYAAPLLGVPAARGVSQDLLECPLVLTANHHGIDFFAQSVQGTLIFSLYKGNGRGGRATVPIFSCGAIPLDNVTYPLGLLLYRVPQGQIEKIPRKFPVFSNRVRRSVVSVAGPLDELMIKRAQSRIERMVQEEEISPGLANCLHEIFSHDYFSAEVMDLPNYSQQSVLLNGKIWNRLFSNSSNAPHLVYLEMEKITHMLLEIDLLNTESLVFHVLFDPELRRRVLKELHGVKACWDLEKLEQRNRMCDNDPKGRNGANGCGTVFFWGINDRGRKFPLHLEPQRKDGCMFRGVDDRANFIELPYTRESILQALNDNRLLPSLFTCFLAISFARGFTCAGGYFQGEYLPAMQKGLVKALRNTKAHHYVASYVEKVRTYTYLSGMQGVMVRLEEGALIPAGPIEIIAGGGLTEEDIEKLLSLSVRDAHLASLLQTIPDIAPYVLSIPDWKMRLALDCGRLLGEKVVIK